MKLLFVLLGILLILGLIAYIGGSLLGELTGAADANSRIEIARVQAEAAAQARIAQAQAEAQVAIAQAHAQGATANALAVGATLPVIALVVVVGLLAALAIVFGYMLVVARPPAR